MAKNNHKSKNKNNKSSSHSNSSKTDPYDFSQPLDSKALKTLVRSLTNQQIRPAVKAAKRASSSLASARQSDYDANGRLVKQATSNTDSYYSDLAKQEAQGQKQTQAISARLSGALTSGAAATQQSIGNAATSSQDALNQNADLTRTAPTSAQDQLAQLVAQSKINAGRESEAYAAAGNQQSSSYEELAKGMAAANQMQGRTTQTEIFNKGVENNRQIQSDYAPSIRDAIGAIKDAKSQKGDVKRSILEEIIGKERDYGLSRQAVGADKAAAAASIKTNAQDNRAALKTNKQDNRAAAKQNAQDNRTSRANNATTAATSRANNAATNATSASNNANTNATSAANNQRTNSGSGGSMNPGDRKRMYAKGKAAAANFGAAWDSQTQNKHDPWTGSDAQLKSVYNYLIDSKGIRPDLAKKIIKGYKKKNPNVGESIANVGSLFGG